MSPKMLGQTVLVVSCIPTGVLLILDLLSVESLKLNTIQLTVESNPAPAPPMGSSHMNFMTSRLLLFLGTTANKILRLWLDTWSGKKK